MLCRFASIVLIALGVSGAAAADVLTRIAERGEIRLGYRADAPPFSYEDETGAPAGLAVMLCKVAAARIRDELGLETLAVTHVKVMAATRFEALLNDEIDLLCGPTTQTLSRRKTLDFSIPYFIDGASAVFRAGPEADIGVLSGARVGMLAGTTTEALLPGLLADRGAAEVKLIGYRTHVEGLEALAAGEITAYFGDQAILRYQLGRLRPTTPLQLLDEQFSFEPYALAMKRGESNLRLAVDSALSAAFESKEVYQMIESSLGEVALSDIALAIYQVVMLPQ